MQTTHKRLDSRRSRLNLWLDKFANIIGLQLQAEVWEMEYSLQ